ncbi:helix-turn-helix transcriptional regulator [Actinoplanes sp. N902-109]|uniref:helix-turn-helix domain-containing protein n=1 Tax=Actinoplanes sp. (strain N902-109) TaxID=649831 RepID=UPI0012FB175A|nr:helix-turn-helix transcriptional regulator [Actinoplanes sp. N902-109]
MSEQKSQTPPSPLRARTAEEIRVILARKKKSAAELARDLRWKQPYLSRRMTGETAFDLDDLEVIANALGVTVAQLVTGTGEETQTTAR